MNAAVSFLNPELVAILLHQIWLNHFAYQYIELIDYQLCGAVIKRFNN